MSAVLPVLPIPLLLVATDPDEVEDLGLALGQAGFLPTVVTSAAACQAQLQQSHPALIMLGLATDVSLQLCQQLRQQGLRLPILLLLTQDSVADRVACLEVGADDYWLKPYHSKDLVQLLQLYLQTPAPTPNDQYLQFERLSLDIASRQAYRNGRTIELTMKEYDLLKYLMEHPRETLSREQILENVWGDNFDGESNVIEVYIRYLRLKIEDEGEKRLIHTVRGIGYVLREG
jgi:two-component system, OmpR family, response regulator NblR